MRALLSVLVGALVIVVIYMVVYTPMAGISPPPGASRGAANVEPPPGYVQQPPPEGNPWQFLAFPIADPGGFAFLLFWVIVFGAYLTIVWGTKRMLITFAIAVVSITLFVLARSLR